jgi:hypothetical protein
MFAVEEWTILAAFVLFCMHRLNQFTERANHSCTPMATIRVSRADTQVINSTAANFSAAFHEFPTI